MALPERRYGRSGNVPANGPRNRISRSQFIRAAGAGAAGIAATGLVAGGAANAKSPPVPGVDIYPYQGLEALQAAVTAGKTIYLHDAWDFQGAELAIGLGGRDVRIIGVNASIWNGTISSNSLVRMDISNLALSSNTWYGINIIKSIGAKISGCEITCTDQSMWPNAIMSYWWDGGTDIGTTDVSGPLEITGNVIDGINGIFLHETKAEIVISNNQIRNANTGVGMVLPRGGSLYMDGNTVNTIWESAVGMILQVSDDYWDTQTSFCRAFIVNNRFECGSTWFGIGYGRWNTQARPSIVVMNNDLHIEDNDWGAFVLHNDCIDTVWAQNKVSGKIRRGFSVATFDSNWPFPRSHFATNNVFRANDFSGAVLDPVADSVIDIYFYPEAAHYYFDVNADNNTVVGNGGQVVDLGIGNTITGSKNLKQHHGPVGAASSEASAIINALKREFWRR